MSEEGDNKDESKDGARPSLRGFARRILREGDEDDRRLDPRELVGAVIDTGDKAKTEIVRMVAREVRAYLEALELHKDVGHMLTNYSLDVRMNISLKPLAEVIAGEDDAAGISLSKKDRSVDVPAEDVGEE